MRPLRLLSVVVMLASLSLILVFYYQYRLRYEELLGYQSLSQVSNRTITQLNEALTKNREELTCFLDEIEQLSATIDSLEGEKLTFKGQLDVLRGEREELAAKISGLAATKDELEKKLSALEVKFGSLDELKKAFRIAKIKFYERRRTEWLQMRLAKIKRLQELDRIALVEGNRGFFVKEGQPIYRATRIRVELEPVKISAHPEE